MNFLSWYFDQPALERLEYPKKNFSSVCSTFASAEHYHLHDWPLLEIQTNDEHENIEPTKVTQSDIRLNLTESFIIPKSVESAIYI